MLPHKRLLVLHNSTLTSHKRLLVLFQPQNCPFVRSTKRRNMDQNPLMSFDAPLLRLHHFDTCTLAHATEKLQRATIATTFPRLIFPSLDQEGGARCRSLGSNQDLLMSRAVQATVPP